MHASSISGSRPRSAHHPAYAAVGLLRPAPSAAGDQQGDPLGAAGRQMVEQRARVALVVGPHHPRAVRAPEVALDRHDRQAERLEEGDALVLAQRVADDAAVDAEVVQVVGVFSGGVSRTGCPAANAARVAAPARCR